jgi:organic hydroperoxide reductase OsmC/OhrA
VTADKGDAGIKLVTSKLDLVAEGLSGIDAASFEAAARDAEGKCPISNALRGNLAIEVAVTIK